MAATIVNPTRMELARLKKKLLTAKRGHKLLKDKRDELMRRFLELVKENMRLRDVVERGIVESNQNFVLAKAVMREEVLNTALMMPMQSLSVKVDTLNVMSVEIPKYSYKTKVESQEDAYSYGLAFTSGDLDYAVKSLADIFSDMLKLAEIEKSCQLMADEIEKTRRRVNALEYVIIPQTENGIRYISMKLDENERGTQVRLMKVKNMMIKERIGAKTK